MKVFGFLKEIIFLSNDARIKKIFLQGEGRNVFSFFEEERCK